MDEDVYTPEEVAKRLKVSEQAIRNWLRNGKIRAVKLGRSWRITVTEYRRILEEGIPGDDENEQH